jgi:hypothetical protein
VVQRTRCNPSTRHVYKFSGATLLSVLTFRLTDIQGTRAQLLKTPEKFDSALPGGDEHLLPPADNLRRLEKSLSAPARGRALASLIRLSKSLTVVLLGLLACLYVAIYYYYPWKDLAAMELPRWIIKFAEGVPNYTHSREYRPLVVFGSSLVIAPSARLNDMHYSKPDEYGYRSKTPGAGIYERAIKSIRGNCPEMKILAVPGSVVSDQVLILRTLIEARKAPKMLVFTLAPRDFMDNEVGEKTGDTATARVLDFVSHNKNFWPQSLTPTGFENCWKSHHSYLDLVRKHFSRSLRDKVCTWSGHPKDLWSAALTKVASDPTQGEVKEASGEAREEKINADNLDPAAMARDLKTYKDRYQPANRATFEQQVEALDQLLAMTKEAHIATLLVEMPLSRENLDLLQPEQKAMLADSVKKLATRYDVDFIDYNQSAAPPFETSDFYDSVHLNKPGARKFVNQFARSLAASKALQNTFH